MTTRFRSAVSTLPVALVLVSVLNLAGCACCGGSRSASDVAPPPPTPEETTLTRIGQTAPDFTVATLDEGTFTLSKQRGKIVLINWFATWCPPCQEEMPHLQKEVWERFGKYDDFVMISVAREEKSDVVAPFVTKYAVTWPFTLDPERKAYAQYAEAFIPRNHVIDREGKIIFQSNGFEEADFKAMIEIIAAELER